MDGIKETPIADSGNSTGVTLEVKSTGQMAIFGPDFWTPRSSGRGDSIDILSAPEREGFLADESLDDFRGFSNQNLRELKCSDCSDFWIC